MENIRQIISENLINLRHRYNFTQDELARKVNYSDKAVSRWETGESLPSYETLAMVASVYNVDITYFFTKHDSDEEIKARKDSEGNKRLVLIFAITAIWTLVTGIFVYNATKNHNYIWQLFIWGIPLSTLPLLWYNYSSLHKKRIWVIGYSVLLWGLLASIYCQFIDYNLWMIFLVGVPIQVCIVALSFLRYPLK